MIFQNPGAEATPATIHQLRNQADLRGEDQHVTAGRQLLLRQLQVHLGLARPGDAPEQHPLSIGNGLKALHHLLLLAGEGPGGLQWGSRHHPSGEGTPIPAHPAFCLQDPDHGWAEARGFQRALPQSRPCSIQRIQELLLAGRETGSGLGWLQPLHPQQGTTFRQGPGLAQPTGG